MDDLFGTNNDPVDDFLARERAANLDTDFGTSDPVDDFLARERAANLDTDFGAIPQLPTNEVFTGASNSPVEDFLSRSQTATINTDFGSVPQIPNTEVFTGAAVEESAFIQNWKVEQAAEIAKRDEESERKKNEIIDKARNDIDAFYKEYNEKNTKNISRNKEEEEEYRTRQQEQLGKGTTWERICELVDLQDSRSKSNTKSKQDLGRFKEILLALKREGDRAPGAAGY